MSIIKVGFCVAYDWELLKKSVPRVYQHADVICFSLDINRKSWSGKYFEFNDNEFYRWVKQIDESNKIRIYEDAFFIDGLNPIENDNRQRMLMAKFMGNGGWHIQIDADEYFFNFRGFKEYLLRINQNPKGNEKPINVCCNWVSLVKKLPKGYLFVNNEVNEYETMPFATNVPEYLNARHNTHFDHISPYFVLHETWARGEEQLLQKINSWGHDKDFLSKQSYFNLWKALDEFNYKYIRNFHPLNPRIWQKLEYVPELNIDKVIEWVQSKAGIKVEKTYLSFRNNRILQGVKQRLNKR